MIKKFKIKLKFDVYKQIVEDYQIFQIFSEDLEDSYNLKNLFEEMPLTLWIYNFFRNFCFMDFEISICAPKININIKA